MAKQLVGKAPLSLVRTVDHGMEYVYARKPVPQSADPADVQRLLDEGFLVEVKSVEAAAEVEVPAPDDPGLANAGPVASTVTVDRPPRAAAKEAWVDYAVAQGVSKTDADGMTKDDLIKRFGA